MERRSLHDMLVQARQHRVFSSSRSARARDSGAISAGELIVSRPFAEEAEAARLDALRVCRMLDTPQHSRFDTFTRSAARTFKVPVAAVCLLDARRRWFMSAIGFDFVESPREGSFCDHVIRNPDHPLIIDDVSEDERFVLVPAPSDAQPIRFYAGVAVKNLEGQPVGAFFVADHVPRFLDAEQKALLIDLAEGIEAVLGLHESVAALGAAVNQDYLTGLLNRGPFQILLDDAVAAATLDRPVAVLCTDLDGFKRINDDHGHATGDAVLIEAARRLSASVRFNDPVARLSGDELAILMSGPVDLASAQRLADRILRAFEPPFLIEGKQIPIRISIGAAFGLDDARNGADLLNCADLALYDAKQRGGGRYSLFNPALERALRGRRQMDSDLAAALRDDSLHLQWQPVFASRSGALRGYEVLLRWNRPGHGAVAPGDFLPAAETGGLMPAVDRWVLTQACSEAAKLSPHLVVSVNIWAGWMPDGDLPDMIRSVLKQTGFDATRLEIEITEHALLKGDAKTLQQIRSVKKLGVRLALDDFGTGYSSLSYLANFPFDTIKLDCNFVQDLCINPRSRAVADAVLKLGHELGMDVCAEGVEKSQQLAILTEHGYDFVQGYLMGHPAALPVL